VPSHDVAKTDDDDDEGGAFSDAHLSGSSIAGDTVASSDVSSDTELARAQPTEPIQENRSRGKSSKYNEEWEVGNFGVYFGNWGERASIASQKEQQRRREVHDRQILKNPCPVLVMCEANPQCEELLTQAAVAGDPDGSTKLQRRPTAKYMVVRGKEPKTSLLIAARTDTCEYLRQLGNYDVHKDLPYTEKGSVKQARTRMLFAKVGFKQNIGHLGKDIVFGVVHWNSRTMRYLWPTVLIEFWDRLANYIILYGVQILTGDFNMSFTEVIPQLRSRGITIDCISWYPWMHETLRKDDQALGLDSCGIFYIGGTAQCKLVWGLDHIDALTAVADVMAENEDLHRYSTSLPGQHWSAYKNQKATSSKANDKSLTQKLQDLLSPSCTQAVLDKLLPRKACYCPYLRFKQKLMDQAEWLVDGKPHNGAHMSQVVFSNNSSHRSEEAQQRRAAKLRNRRGSRGGKAYTSEETQRRRGNAFQPAQITAVADDQSSWAGLQWAGSPWNYTAVASSSRSWEDTAAPAWQISQSHRFQPWDVGYHETSWHGSMVALTPVAASSAVGSIRSRGFHPESQAW